MNATAPVPAGVAKCKTKIRHATLDLAQRVAAAASAKHGLTLSAYRCPFCGAYHLTSRKQR